MVLTAATPADKERYTGPKCNNTYYNRYYSCIWKLADCAIMQAISSLPSPDMITPHTRNMMVN
jgi:ribosomal protein L37AE/L43A